MANVFTGEGAGDANLQALVGPISYVGLLNVPDSMGKQNLLVLVTTWRVVDMLSRVKSWMSSRSLLKVARRNDVHSHNVDITLARRTAHHMAVRSGSIAGAPGPYSLR